MNLNLLFTVLSHQNISDSPFKNLEYFKFLTKFSEIKAFIMKFLKFYKNSIIILFGT